MSKKQPKVEICCRINGGREVLVKKKKIDWIDLGPYSRLLYHVR